MSLRPAYHEQISKAVWGKDQANRTDSIGSSLVHDWAEADMFTYWKKHEENFMSLTKMKSFHKGRSNTMDYQW